MTDTTGKVRPFDSGSQFTDWIGCNCMRCAKYNFANPQNCEIDYALGLGYLGDGLVTDEIARRMGYTDNKGRYVWMCGEVEWTEDWKAEYTRRHAAQQGGGSAG